MGRGHALAGARCHVDHQASFVAVFGGWCAVDHFERLNRIDRNLVREDLALLVRDRLAVHRKRVLRVVAETVEKTVRIRGDSGRRESNQRANGRRCAFERQLVESAARSTSVCAVESVSSRSPAASTVTVLLAPASCRLTFHRDRHRRADVNVLRVACETVRVDAQVIRVERNIREN